MKNVVSIKEKINKIINSKGISKSFFAKQINMSLPGFNSMIEVNDCKLSTLYKICEVYHVSIDYLTKNEVGLFFHETEEKTHIDKENNIAHTQAMPPIPNELQYKLDSCREINQRLNHEIFELKDELVKFKRLYYKENYNNG